VVKKRRFTKAVTKAEDIVECEYQPGKCEKPVSPYFALRIDIIFPCRTPGIRRGGLLPSLLMPLFWLSLVLVIVDCFILGLRFRDTIEFHRQPSQHRDNPFQLSFQGQAHGIDCPARSH
jgi:hypothetical protein